MSVEQRVKISCDNFECNAAIHSGRGLTDARAMSGQAGWVVTFHYLGIGGQAILQDFCPTHRDQAFDWETYRATERGIRDDEVVDEPDESLDDCAACDTPLSECGGRSAACCDDCTHSANWAPVRENGSEQ